MKDGSVIRMRGGGLVDNVYCTVLQTRTDNAVKQLLTWLQHKPPEHVPSPRLPPPQPTSLRSVPRIKLRCWVELLTIRVLLLVVELVNACAFVDPNRAVKAEVARRKLLDNIMMLYSQLATQLFWNGSPIFCENFTLVCFHLLGDWSCSAKLL